ncbi:MAG: hypothetical protein C0592_01605 [Marinilabiliales bacterium]|nr:MAG: hypothetical protein C0592_01605 [Marinilabiliales bacterium]
MIILLWIVLIFAALYFILLIVMSLAFRKQELSGSTELDYTVIIAARNEEENIQNVLKSLEFQTIKPVSIIIVSDHSDDNTAIKANSFSVEHPEMNILVYESTGYGKREAIKKACELATTELVLSLDADCSVHANWAESMLTSKNEIHRVVGAPVLYGNSNSVLSFLFRSELLQLVAGGVAAAKMNLPFQISGGGMLFYRDDYLSFADQKLGKRHNHGDDVFFMQFLLQKYKRRSVGVSTHRFSVVLTNVPKSLSAFLRQRIRWASKAVSYQSIIPFLFGFIAILKGFLYPLAIFLFIISGLEAFFIPAGIVLTADYLFSASAAIQMRYKYSIVGQLLLFVFYPFILLSVLLALPFSGKTKWKGRPV